MPTPRKARKSNKNLSALEEEVDENDGKIEIYTDSKERIPTASDDDNPFVTKKRKGKGKAKAKSPSQARKVDPKTAKMQEAVDRGEGMIYML